MEIGDKVIWADHYDYEVGWIISLNDSETSFKLISGPREGSMVSKPTSQVEGFSEEAYEYYSKIFGKKFGK